MVYIVGCNHAIQPRDEDWLTGDTSEAREQKAHFAGLIKQVIQEGGIQFVGEEWGRSEITTAHAIANTHQIPWSNINTSLEDLDGLGIPHGYVKADFSEAQKKHWHSQREQTMLRKLKENRREAQNILIVCGFDHMESIADLLRRESLVAKILDYRKEGWYQPGVFSEDP